MIEERENNEIFYASLNRGLQANETQKEFFNKYVEIFNSNSYSILFQIIPGLILINKGEEIFDIESDTAIIIKYFQLILCIFEDFRFKYFILKGRNEEYIQDLYSNCEFNQMILNISMIFRQIMTFSIVPLDLFETLETYWFLCFIRSQNYKLYQCLNLNRYFIKVDFKDTVNLLQSNSKLLHLKNKRLLDYINSM